MNTYIIDASIAAKWFFDEDLAEEARRLVHRKNRLSAPDFFLLEMDSIFCKRIRRGDITVTDGDDARGMLRRFPIEYYAFASLQNLAYDIAKQTGQGIYDCLYLALSVQLSSRMVTADRRFYNGLKANPFAKCLTWIEEIT